MSNQCGAVVQLVRIPACHAGVAGSSPVRSATYLESLVRNSKAFVVSRVFNFLFVLALFTIRLSSS